MSIFALAMQYLPLYGLIATALMIAGIVLMIVERVLRDQRMAVNITNEAKKAETSVNSH